MDNEGKAKSLFVCLSPTFVLPSPTFVTVERNEKKESLHFTLQPCVRCSVAGLDMRGKINVGMCKKQLKTIKKILGELSKTTTLLVINCAAYLDQPLLLVQIQMSANFLIKCL